MLVKIYSGEKWAMQNRQFKQGMCTNIDEPVTRQFNVEVGDRLMMRNYPGVPDQPVIIKSIEWHAIRAERMGIVYGYELFPISNVEEDCDL